MGRQASAGPFIRAFGRTVRERRAQLQISQEELGYRSELDRTYVSGIERGVRNPTLAIIASLARALETKPSRLMSAAERKS